MEKGSQAFQAQFDDARIRFMNRSLVEIDSMRPLRDRLLSGDDEAVRQLGLWGHRVSGTAAVLGIREISIQGGEIEKIARTGGHDSRREAARGRRIDRAVERLAAQLKVLTQTPAC